MIQKRRAGMNTDLFGKNKIWCKHIRPTRQPWLTLIAK